MDTVVTLSEMLEIKLKRNKLPKTWLAHQMSKRGEDMSLWKFYNLTTPGRAEEKRTEEILKKCHEILDDYEKRMAQ